MIQLVYDGFLGGVGCSVRSSSEAEFKRLWLHLERGGESATGAIAINAVFEEFRNNRSLGATGEDMKCLEIGFMNKGTSYKWALSEARAHQAAWKRAIYLEGGRPSGPDPFRKGGH